MKTKTHFAQWDTQDKDRYNWLFAKEAQKFENASDLPACGSALVQCAQQIENERKAAKQKSKTSIFWNEELKDARKRVRKLRKIDRSSKERKKAGKELKKLIEKRTAEIADATAIRWAHGLRNDAKFKWKEIKTQKLLSETGLAQQTASVKAGCLTSYQGPPRILQGQKAADEVGAYAMRLNAQSWEVEGLSFDQEFALIYSGFQGWRGCVQDKQVLSTPVLEPGTVQSICHEDIQYAEIEVAFERTKAGKAAGGDDTKNENFHALDVMNREVICRLLQLLFSCYSEFCTKLVHGEEDAELYLPEPWSNSIVFFLDKSSTKDHQDLQQKRGIRLLSCFGKLWRQVLAQRFRLITSAFLRESQSLKTNEGCTTNALIVTQKVGERLARSMKTYAVFIDLVKAFDTVNRKLLWARYRSKGICGKLYWALRAGYKNCTLQGRLGSLFSKKCKDEGLGVRQGEVDSSDAFALFIDDLDEEIERAERRTGRKLGIPLVGNNDGAAGDRIPVLKHADDTVLLATCEEDAQIILDAVDRWCQKWQISPNPDKCVVIVFAKGGAAPRPNLKLLGKTLKIVKETVYLGYLLHQEGTWVPHVNRRISKAEKWDTIARQLLGHHGGATLETAASVRAAAGEVGALYGAEFWGSSKDSAENNAVNKNQASVAKEILHVRSTAEAEGVLTELGWATSSTLALKQRLLFWWRLGRTESKILRDLEWQSHNAEIEANEGRDEIGTSDYDWWRTTRTELQRFSSLTKLPSAELRKLPRVAFQDLLNKVFFKTEFTLRIHRMKNNARLLSYGEALEKSAELHYSHCDWKKLQAGYTAHVSSKYHVRLLAMARLGLLPIEIETGRWHKIEKSQRLCKDCNGQLGDMEHFLCKCTALAHMEPVPSWSDAPPRNAKNTGAWWRLAARKLEMRWKFKRNLKNSEKAELQFLIDAALDEEECFIADAAQLHEVRPIFLGPNDDPPKNISFELFTDGSKTKSNQMAGWGVWGVFFAADGSIGRIVEENGPVDVCHSDGQERHQSQQTNMTGELLAILHALAEIQKLPAGSGGLLRFDCIPAIMLAIGAFRARRNVALVEKVHNLWCVVSVTHTIRLLHAKGHARIFGNVRADKLAQEGALLLQPRLVHKSAADMGGVARFAERYSPADCGTVADRERRRLGRRKGERRSTLQHATNSRVRAVQNHLLQLGVSKERAAKIMTLVEDLEEPNSANT